MKTSLSVGRSPRPSNRAMLALATLLVFALTLTGVFAVTPPKKGEKAKETTWAALNGGKVKLSALTKKSPVVLIVLRGFPGYQCPICTQQVGDLIANAEKFGKAQVILVYPGPAEGLKAHADEFVSGKDIPKNFRFVLDPDFKFLKSYGLRWDAPGETSYPSSFVLDQKGKIVFAQVSHSHGDRAKTEDLLNALPKSK